MGALDQFQESGDTGSLLEFVQASGRDVKNYEQAIAGLAPVFEALNFGEQPQYQRLDTDRLSQLKAETKEIVTWMCGSNKADMRTIGIELMGVLGYASFLPSLEHFLFSGIEWERLTAIAALGKMSGERPVELLRMTAQDPNPQIQAEALRVLGGRGKL